MIDILNEICEFNDCNIRACFNLKGNKKGRFCNQHKLENMINVMNCIIVFMKIVI